MSGDKARHPGHEQRDVSFTPVVIGAAGIVAMVLIAVFAMVAFFDVLANREKERGGPANPLAAEAARVPPLPRLQTQPILDLRTLRAAEREMLDGYGWVDRDAGVVRIPIDRAMDLLAERGGAVRQP